MAPMECLQPLTPTPRGYGMASFMRVVALSLAAVLCAAGTGYHLTASLHQARATPFAAKRTVGVHRVTELPPLKTNVFNGRGGPQDDTTVRPARPLVRLDTALLAVLAFPAAAAAAPAVSLAQQATAVLAPLFTVALFSAPLEVVFAINKAKGVGDFSLLPYLTMQLNACLWTFYGFLLGDPSVVVPNVVGVAVSTLTIGVFALYSRSPNERLEVLKKALINAAVLFAIFSMHLTTETVGQLGCLSTIVLFASPLAELGQIISRRDSSSMPFTQILMGFFCTVLWTIYGWCVGNFTIVAPNVLGFFLSAAQLLIHRKYRRVA